MTEGSSAGSFVLPTGTVAFLLTDIEGSSRLWESDAEAMERAMALHDATLDEAVSAHGGVRPLAQGEGDSIVAAFARASDAVLAARDAQRALTAADWPTETPLRVRMAVHSGEARFVDAGSYAGQAIIRTARLRSIAHGGQVLVSAPARDLTVDQLGDDVELIDLGEHRLRDLARPERVWQLVDDALPSTFPPLPSLDTHHHNLPVQLSTFIGRVEEIATVASLMSTNRLVTITGAGGSGKTRMALQVAAELVGRWRDGTWWVELADQSDPDAVAAEIAASVGVKGEVGEDAADALAGIIESREMLVVLDNCEHLVVGVSRAVDRLMRRCPDLRVLATSREPLEVASEVTWRVPPLSLPEVRSPASVDALAQLDSVRLFLDRARQMRPNFHLDDDVAPVVAEICHRLDGIPLAIELAAARVRSLTPAQILGGLDDAIRLLAGSSRAALPRQATLEASITWSHDLLSPDEQIVFRRLAVFSGGCTLDDAEAVVADDLLPSTRVLDVIDRLLAQSLVTLDDRSAIARYRMLETVRQYASRRLAEADETDLLRIRHARRYAQVACELGPQLEGPDEHTAIAQLVPEIDNIRASLGALADREEWLTLTSAVCALTQLWLLVDPVDGNAWLTLALEHTASDDAATRARLHFGRAWLQLGGGNLIVGVVDAREALEAADLVEDETTGGRALSFLAGAGGLVDPTASDAAFTQATARCRRAGDAFGEAWAHCAWAFSTLMTLGDTERGWQRVAEAETRVAAAGNGSITGFFLAIVANGHCVQGDFGSALQAVARAEAAIRPSFEAAGVDQGLLVRRSLPAAYTTFAREWATTSQGGGLGSDAMERTIESARAEGFFLPEMLLGLCNGSFLALNGKIEEAIDRLAPLVAKARAMGFGVVAVIGTGMHAYAELARGHLARAHQLLDEVEATTWPYYEVARTRCCRGAVLLAQGEVAQAEARAHEALDQAVRFGFRIEATTSLQLLASCAVASGSPVEAARLHGAARRQRAEVGLALFWPGEADRIESDLRTLSASLGEEDLQQALDEGGALTLAEAAQLARRARGARGRPALGWASLTPTELQVVEHVQAGLTNPEIAAKLLMSRETVKTHLSHVFTKLGVSSRAALAAAAASRQES